MTKGSACACMHACVCVLGPANDLLFSEGSFFFFFFSFFNTHTHLSCSHSTQVLSSGWTFRSPNSQYPQHILWYSCVGWGKSELHYSVIPLCFHWAHNKSTSWTLISISTFQISRWGPSDQSLHVCMGILSTCKLKSNIKSHNWLWAFCLLIWISLPISTS